MNPAGPRRPLLGAAAAIAAGAVFGAARWEGGSAAFAASACVAAAAFAALRFSPRRVRETPAARVAAAVALFAAAFAASAFNAARAAAGRMDTVELFREALDSREAAFRGRVVGEPVVLSLKHGGARMSFDLVPSEIVFENDVVPVPDGGLKVRVEWYGPRSMDSDRPPFPVPREGEGWAVEGRLREIPVRSPVPLVAVSLRRGDGGARRAPRFDAPPWRMALRDLRRAASGALGRGLPRDDTGLAIVRAMVLGERADVPESVAAAFKASGTIHVFAISGLHVGIVAVALSFLLKRARVPAAAGVAVLAAALSLYVAVAGARPSAVRALAMSLLAFGAPLAGRRADPVLSLSGALAVLLAFDPLGIYDLGFAFSFLCTGAILALAGPFSDVAAGLLRATAAGAAAERTVRGLAEIPRGVVLWIAAIPTVSVAAWLASAPLTAACFGQLAPVSMLCNLAVLPLAAGAVVAALAALAEAAVLPAAFCAAVPLQKLAAAVASAMARCAEVSASLPGAALETPPWPPAAVAAWYAALLVLAAFLHRDRG